MEDSGIDSDNKPISNGMEEIRMQDTDDENEDTVEDKSENSALKTLRKTPELKKKIDKQREINCKSQNNIIDTQPKRGLLSRSRLFIPKAKRNPPPGLHATEGGDFQPLIVLDSDSRLPVPSKFHRSEFPIHSPDMQPLVMLESDDSDDEFALPKLSKQAQREITQQLIKDGYNLDLEPDDEDLDLIPPRPVSDRCACCPHMSFNISNMCAQQ